MALKTGKKSLADKINSLITTTPTNFCSDEEIENVKAEVVQHEDDSEYSNNLEYSKIRNQNVELLDETDASYGACSVLKCTFDPECHMNLRLRKSVTDTVENLSHAFDLNTGSTHPVYAGKKVSRQDVHEDTNSVKLYSNSENEVSESDTDNVEIRSAKGNTKVTFQTRKKVIKNIKDNNEGLELEYVEDSDGDSITEDENDCDIANPLYKHRKIHPKFTTMITNNLKADIDKGNSIRCQLKMWENLLEVRIKLQKCLITSNQMPQYDTHRHFQSEMEFVKNTDETKAKLKMLLNNMLKLQSSLMKQYPEAKNMSIQCRKRKFDETKTGQTYDNDFMDEEISSDTEDEREQVECSKEQSEINEVTVQKRFQLSDYENILAKCHKSYVQYYTSIIQKWNEKTRVATGNLNKAMGQTTLSQIEFALSDKQKLRKKTQLKRSEYKIIGKTVGKIDADGRRIQEYDPEIYDDDDFYHQLLRDLIEYKSSDVTDPVQLSKQWIQLQNMRNKMKRKIDTRATKGRRIRYNIHSKLVNFMTPIVVHDTWTDYAKDELYNSLFGKLKSADTDIGH